MKLIKRLKYKYLYPIFWRKASMMKDIANASGGEWLMYLKYRFYFGRSIAYYGTVYGRCERLGEATCWDVFITGKSNPLPAKVRELYNRSVQNPNK